MFFLLKISVLPVLDLPEINFRMNSNNYESDLIINENLVYFISCQYTKKNK